MVIQLSLTKRVCFRFGETYRDDETERLSDKANLSLLTLSHRRSVSLSHRLCKTNSDAVQGGVSREFVNQIVVGQIVERNSGVEFV